VTPTDNSRAYISNKSDIQTPYLCHHNQLSRGALLCSSVCSSFRAAMHTQPCLPVESLHVTPVAMEVEMLMPTID
jgi:hypothetical protein